MSNPRFTHHAGRRSFLTLIAILLAGSCFAQEKLLVVGSARVDITPPLTAESESPTGKFEHEKLYVRAIVVDNGVSCAVLLGADQAVLSDGIWNEATRRISKELKCQPAAILMSATHMHSPGVAMRPPQLSVDGSRLDTHEQVAVDAMVEAARLAKAKLQPAQMSFGTGAAYLNVNRDAVDPKTHRWTQAPNVLAASDKTVAVLQFVSLSGEPIAVYVNYAMHPVNGYLSNFTSADFAGAMSRYVEQAYGDKATVIFSQGASGDQNPLYLRASTNGLASRSGALISGGVLTREPVEATLRDGEVVGHPMDAQVREQLERWMESEGDILGEEVIRVMTNATRMERKVRIGGTETVITCPGRERTDHGREGMEGTYVDGAAIPIRVGALGIGDVMLTWADAEIYTLIGQRVKRQSPMANTVFVTLANGRSPSGYIPDDASFGHSTFQVLNSHLKMGCAEDAISDSLTKLSSEYYQQKP